MVDRVQHDQGSVSVSNRTGDLVRALVDEVRTLEDLRSVLALQRDGVANNDQETIEASVQSMERTLLTLEAARQRRQAIIILLGGDGHTRLSALESCLDVAIPSDLVAARREVAIAAATTAEDLVVNRHVLDRALQAGDAYLQRLFSSLADQPPRYRRDRLGALLIDGLAAIPPNHGVEHGNGGPAGRPADNRGTSGRPNE